MSDRYQEVQESTQKQNDFILQAVLDMNQEPILVVNSNQNILNVNRIFTEILGYQKLYLLSTSLNDIIPTNQLNSMKVKFNECQQQIFGVSFPIEINDLYGRNRKYQCRLKLVSQIENEYIYLMVFQKEEQWKEQESRYQALFEQASDAIMVHDFNGRFVEINQNACNALGYTKEELLSMNVTDIEQDFDLKKAQEEWIKIEPETAFTLYGHQKRKDGSIFSVEVQFGCFYWEGRKLYLGLIKDITEREQDKREIQEKEAFNRIIMDHLPIGIAVNSVFPTVDFVYMNELFPSIYGTTRAALETSDSFWDAVYEDPVYRREMVERIQADISSGDPNRLLWEDVLIANTGQDTRYISAYATPVPNQNLLISTVIDVTKRKKAEMEVNRIQALLNVSQRLSQVGGWEYDLNNNRMLWTDEVYRIHGVSHEFEPDDINKNISFYSTQDQIIITGAFQKLVEEGIPYNLELKMNPFQGEPIWVRVSGQAVCVDGKQVRVFGHIMDITLQKQAREAIQKKSDLFKMLNDMDKTIWKGEEPEEIGEMAIKHLLKQFNPDYIYIGFLDQQEKNLHYIAVTDNNTETEKGEHILNEEDFKEFMKYQTGRLEIVEDIDTIKKLPILASMFREEGIHSIMIIPLLAGKELVGVIQLSYLELHKYSDEETEMIIEIAAQLSLGIEQIRLRKLNIQHALQLEERVRERTEQLEVANKELEAFSYSVSHDLRAPLRAVDGYVTMLLEDYSGNLDDEGRRICDVISKSAEQMGTLIDDLLAFSRIGRAVIQPTMVDMNEMIEGIYYELTSAKERDHISFIVGTLPKAYVDRSLMRQVFINLISNAIKFSSKKAQTVIEVKSYLTETEVIYEVKDQGAGFDMQYADKLFGVFQRLHSTREFEGTGVGLAIVQRIINRHGGKIWADSAVNQGATFSFCLKREDDYGTSSNH